MRKDQDRQFELNRKTSQHSDKRSGMGPIDLVATKHIGQRV